MTTPRKSLVDVLGSNGMSREQLAKAFDETEAADDLRPIPPGLYRARVTSGELTESKTAKPGYTVTFTITDGEHRGRKLWLTCWLTSAALAMAKRDLSRLGITSLDQLEKPLPACFECEVKVALHTDDDGTERNRVRDFAVVGIVSDPTGDDDFGDPDLEPAPT